MHDTQKDNFLFNHFFLSSFSLILFSVATRHTHSELSIELFCCIKMICWMLIFSLFFFMYAMPEVRFIEIEIVDGNQKLWVLGWNVMGLCC
jgi:hypothetical protein